MIKRYHEAPKSIFKTVQAHTDGDYALVHLFETDKDYYHMFVKSLVYGRDVILDNSLFELGEAFDAGKFAGWVYKLQPTWYIVPDCWKEGKKTTEMFFDFINKYSGLPGKRIGVAQGKTVEEVAECYKAIEPHCDMVAFNLDFASETPLSWDGYPYCVHMSAGRVKVIGKLHELGVINTDKPHHLLGCGVPQECLWYPRSWEWIRSIDTSNPVMHGLAQIRYPESGFGMQTKVPDKLCDHVNDEVSYEQLRTIMHNIDLCKVYCSDEGGLQDAEHC